MGTYSGTAIRRWRTPAETQNFAPDPAHGVRDTPDPYGGVHQVDARMGEEYAGTSMPVDVVVGGGSVLATPSRSHRGRAGRAHVVSDDQHRQEIGDLHAEDGQRGYVRSSYSPPGLQESQSEWSDDYYHGNTWPEHKNNTGAPAVLRGLHTAIPQNNPQGVREGMVRAGPWYEARRRLGRRRLQYGAQQSILRAIWYDRNVPAPANADPTAAGPVLDSWQPIGALSRVKRPALFRSPPTVSQALQSSTPPVDDQVIGGGF